MNYSQLPLAFQAIYHDIQATELDDWLERLPAQLVRAIADKRHGNMQRWLSWLDQLPDIVPSTYDLTNSVTIGNHSDLSPEQQKQLEQTLQLFHPWRKGPYKVFGIDIDTEWRSDWKWQRLLPHITSLQGRLVLDVGCGSGYHCWRMYGAGARLVVGVDATMLYFMQFAALKKYLADIPVHLLPIRSDELGVQSTGFDTVFSMGVLYHCRSPFDHLYELKNQLRQGGELVLETLVVEGGEGVVLVPERRYAKMRNVWFLPSCLSLEAWLYRCGFIDVRLVDVSITTSEEQRRTEWMKYESLTDFLDPEDDTKTIEGYPAPRRAIFIATLA